jgi:hypothetical protein
VLAAFDEGVARMSRRLAEAATPERGWRERLQAGLVALLTFLDEQPLWARLLILEPPVAALAVFERRQRALAGLARAIERETQARAIRFAGSAQSRRLTADLVVGGVFAVIGERMREGGARSFSELTPSLMAFVLGSYQSASVGEVDNVKLPTRTTYRTARVLSAIDALPRPNNREIAEAAGLRDEGQTSKLLSRLERRGWVENVGLGAAYGEPNAWLLTASGERVLRAAGQVHALGGRGAVGTRRAGARSGGHERGLRVRSLA